jgi:hypothetical protein
MIRRDIEPLLELRENELVHHGLAKQQEALLDYDYAQRNDYKGISLLISRGERSAISLTSTLSRMAVKSFCRLP